jgi:hypothetical protein
MDEVFRKQDKRVVYTGGAETTGRWEYTVTVVIHETGFQNVDYI